MSNGYCPRIRLKIVIVFVLFLAGKSYSTDYDSLKALIDKSKDQCIIADICNQLSENYLLTNSDSAIFYSKRAVRHSENCGSELAKATSFLNNGTAMDVSGRYTEAYEATTKAIKIFRMINDNAGECQSLFRLGKISFHQSECTSEEGRLDYYTDAMENYTGAINLANELGDTLYVIDNQIELGRVLFCLHYSDSALKILNNALSICKKKSSNLEYLHNVAKSSFNIALIYIQMDSLEKAIEFLFAAASTDSLLNNKEGVALIRAAEIYLKLGYTDKAFYMAKRSLDTAVKYGFHLRIFQANEILYKTYEKKGEFQKAYQTLLIYKQMNDSLKDDGNIKEINKIKLQNEFEIKQKQEQLENQAKLEKQKLVTYSVIAAMVLLIVFLAYGIYTYKQKQKANVLLKQQNEEINQQKEEITAQRDEISYKNESLSQQNEEITAQRDEIESQRDTVTKQKEHIEEIHHEVTQSIDYATRLQAAILPNISILVENVSDHFVLFRPKDKVSGDFYWWTKVEDTLVITVADCTGHGIPGAFISMLGVSFLREIVMNEYIVHPAVILKKLRKEVIKALKQSRESGTRKDGMDMNIIAISSVLKSGSQIRTAEWAGANNPLWILRNNDENVYEDQAERVVEIKPDKMPIAIYDRMDKFTNHEIELHRGDRLYLFSDGFPDQFGGPKGKKYMHKGFKRLLAGTSSLSMEQQFGQIEKELYGWMNFEDLTPEGTKNVTRVDQVDDITLVGIEI